MPEVGECLDAPRQLNLIVFATAIAGYGVSLVDASNFVWLPLLFPLAMFAVRVFEPRVPAWTLLVVSVAVVVALNVELHAEGAFFLVCIAAFATAASSNRWWPDRTLVLAAGASPLVDVAISTDEVQGWNWPFWTMGVLVSGFFGSILWEQRRLNAALAGAQEQLADKAAVEERRRIAREVHDLVGHSLTVVLLHLTGARRLVHRDPHEAEAALLEAERAGRHSLADIRRTVALLRDSSDTRTPTPGGQDIARLVAESNAAGMRIDLNTDGPVDDLEGTMGLTVYRIVQEALANAARHAPGCATTIAIAVRDQAVTLDITCHAGSPLPGPGPAGQGLLGMRERATALGGDLLAGPSRAGWTVSATLPVASDDHLDGADPGVDVEAAP